MLEEITQNEFDLVNRSPLTRPSEMFPVFTLRNNQLKISPSIIEVTINYVRKPEDIIWNYNVGQVGEYNYESNGSQDFELSDIEQTEVIIKILQYAGIIIRDPQIVQTAAALSQQDEMAEKT